MVQPRGRVSGRRCGGRGRLGIRIGGNSPRSVGLALRGRGPRALDRKVSSMKVSGMNAGGGWER